MAVLDDNLSKVFSKYFVEGDNKIKEYSDKLFARLMEGHIATEVELADVDDLKKSKYVSSNEGELNKPFVLFDQRLYLQRYFLYETKIVLKLKELFDFSSNQKESRKKKINVQKPLINQLFQSQGSDEIDWQMIAALNAAIEQFAIITGGPGTGKTTTVAKLLALLFASYGDLKVALAAQTGKAASRLKESLNQAKDRLAIDPQILESFDTIVPSTLHRLLGFVPQSIDFKHNQAKHLPYDVIIIDEASMIDVPLMAKLFDAIDVHTRLIFLGDRFQLASVEAGSIFGDLCKSAMIFNGETVDINCFDEEKIKFFNSFLKGGEINSSFVSHKGGIGNAVCELKKSYRFSAEKGIGLLAHKILMGESIDIDLYQVEPEDEGVFIRTGFQDEAFEKYLLFLKSYIQEEDVQKALQLFNQVKVLCAIREGDFGVNTLNKRIEDFLSIQKLIERNDEFYENRPILITKNDYNLGLYNGDVGICRKNKAGEMRAYFEVEGGILKDFNPYFLSSNQTVFAMTIHKSQGSEFENVVLVLPNEEQGRELLTRELVYTAVTRAKKKVLMICSEEVLNQAVGVTVERVSGIIERV